MIAADGADGAAAGVVAGSGEAVSAAGGDAEHNGNITISAAAWASGLFGAARRRGAMPVGYVTP